MFNSNPIVQTLTVSRGALSLACDNDYILMSYPWTFGEKEALCFLSLVMEYTAPSVSSFPLCGSDWDRGKL